MQLNAPLTQLRADLWKMIKQDAAPVRGLPISEDDIVVFVVGPTGSGKSWFVKEATKNGLVNVSRGSHPCTRHVEAVRCDLTDEAKSDLNAGVLNGMKSIVFVDTPSFLTGCDQPDAQEEMKTWFNRTVYNPRYAGIIYMHRIETDPALEPIQQHLQEFSAIRRISDGHLPQRVHVVISYDMTSSNISKAKIEERIAKLRTQMDSLKSSRWQLSLHQGLFRGDPGVAWKAVEELFTVPYWDGSSKS